MAPMHKTPSEAEIASTLGSLKLYTKTPQKTAQKPKSKPIADNWDDDGNDDDDEEASSSDGETKRYAQHALSTPSSRDAPDAISLVASHNLAAPCPPPPTPASPTFCAFEDKPASESNKKPDRRPDKTIAVAGRLIAGALGVRAPKRSEEEKEYDRAMRDKERKKRVEERERESKEAEEREARKKAVWED